MTDNSLIIQKQLTDNYDLTDEEARIIVTKEFVIKDLPVATQLWINYQFNLLMLATDGDYEVSIIPIKICMIRNIMPDNILAYIKSIQLEKS